MRDLRVDPALRSLLALGASTREDVVVAACDDRLRTEATRLAQRLRLEYSDLETASIPGVQEARSLYRSLGIDPTRVRPSSEALLRRILKGQPLPRIDGAVDAANLVSVDVLLPVGLYDAARIDGDVEVRLGRAGEGYQGIGKDRVNVDGRITLCDRGGPFGNPTSDSFRTRVTHETRELLFVVFAPRRTPRARLEDTLRRADALFARAVGGRPVRDWLLSD